MQCAEPFKGANRILGMINRAVVSREHHVVQSSIESPSGVLQSSMEFLLEDEGM